MTRSVAAEAAAIAEKYRRRPKPCLIAVHPHRALIAALIERGVNDTDIEREMRERKTHVTDSTLRRHRRHECGCFA